MQAGDVWGFFRIYEILLQNLLIEGNLNMRLQNSAEKDCLLGDERDMRLLIEL
jgi:hypothetical protein